MARYSGTSSHLTAARLPQRAGVGLIRVYQRFISPAFPPRCRFSPSCSQYTLEAVERYGLVRGSWLGFKRIVRCHPFHPGGYDPVP
jgi:putative membrane protein insertion efficiency factor